MDFNLSQSQTHWLGRVRAFIADAIVPAAAAVAAERAASRAPAPTMERLKERARAEGLWNLFLPPSPGHDTDAYRGAGLTNLDYALCAEAMGRVGIASECFNCAAPDTGNMEVLHRYGTAAQKDRWLKPLMAGEIRSAFLMTEPEVASSDATNIATSIRRDGDHYVIDGRKWWSTGVGDPRCRIAILMGKTDPEAPRHKQQSQILVPMDTAGVRVERLLPVFGYEDAPKGHGEVVLENVRVPAENLILGEGRGFEIAQGRLGPGRIHHCMRTIGAAEVALEAMARRLVSRVAFGKRISEQSVWEQRVAEARIDIEMTRLLCLKAADMMDKVGAKGAKLEIAMIKVAAPRVALKVIDDAIQAHGGAGVSEDFGLARMYAHIRTLRLADGPDEVHNRSIARLEFGRYTNARPGAEEPERA
ncbi:MULTISPECIES: acyl-CoA dehydrogenase family protein [Methylobacterium]|uniref:Acyl-CoA dehydrogenase family protein n=1 Tax=Methylobacterium longum TaxID=767694 RepID=A0ABT8AX93_9HYPH|nr:MULTISPECIES: acyl-CoA dehydrogenase family protein [Methylobacterium]MCJ2102664.1 acyl-CoA dehydrogenase family protein [Methylobacterium sp. E-046]MDN3574443.1 acyl-CoA dehydrogenase family protein [Methylobacterium longum]GJE10256.1 (R)-benzylsuccinyl-CoA dehydrogenase [Methylobacterium longum]